MKIGLIVGNGISQDFRSYSNTILSSWNPSNPLSWTIPTPGKSSSQLIEHLELFRTACNKIRTNNPAINDFDLFNTLVQEASTRCPTSTILDVSIVEARHYLVIAFSLFQTIASKVDNNAWQWTRWFAKHKFDLFGAVSFNYDLILEKALLTAGIKYHRFLSNDKLNRFPILKPHGSVDFEFKNLCFSDSDDGKPTPPSYPLNGYVEMIDLPASRINDLADILKPRNTASVVLPEEESRYHELKWVKPGFDWWRQNAPTFSYLVIIGSSYRPCDRYELNMLSNAVPSSATIAVIAGESPNLDMLTFLRNRFSKIIIGDYSPINF